MAVRLASLAAIVIAALLGCTSLDAARLYGNGTRALDRGDTATAILDLEHAARLRPEVSEIQNHLGLAYLAAGRRQDALLAFERALVLDCDNQAARHNLDVVRAQADP